MSTTLPSPSKNDMIGSIHIYSNGYGYGIRMPTSRNVPTIPACVPTMRYPPESARFLEGTTSTQVIKKDEASVRRNNQAMIHQTSGDYGRWYTEPNSGAVKLGLGKIPQQEPKRTYKPRIEPPTTDNRRFESARLGTPMLLTHDASVSYNHTRSLKNTASSEALNGTWSSARQQTGHSSTSNSNSSANNKTQYYETLKQLDKQFTRQSRKDLFAATLSQKSEQEQIHVVAASHHAAQSSKIWSDKLRI